MQYWKSKQFQTKPDTNFKRVWFVIFCYSSQRKLQKKEVRV